MKASTIKKVGIVGVSGYSGAELLKILLNHKSVRVTYVAANNTTGKVSDIWPHFKNKTKLFCHSFKVKDAINQCELIFLALPHSLAMNIAPKLLLAGIKVIDLSGDYRLKKAQIYEKFYGVKHRDPTRLNKAVFGLPELYREKIKKAKLIANPGCYPTAAILSLAPLAMKFAKSITNIVIDAKSGTTGAGRKATAALSFSESNENFKAYKVTGHQHTPEIEQYLSKVAGKNLSVTFVPHLLPCSRGIFETIYIKTSQKISVAQLHTLYKKFYKTEPFVRVLEPGKQPELKFVSHTNYCDIGIAVDTKNNTVIITAAIDNLLKGAAGQAVQNMNIILNAKETSGLR